QRIGTRRAAGLARQRLGALERGEPAPDEKLIPARAVLVEQEDGLAGWTGARLEARGLDLHQRDEAVHLRLTLRKLGEDAAEAKRLLAELRPHPVVARGRRIALVEDEIDDREHRGEARGKLLPARDLGDDARLAQGSLGAQDALLDGQLRHEEGARDLLRGQSAEQAKRERGPRLWRENRVA